MRFSNAMMSVSLLFLVVAQAQVSPTGTFLFFEPVQPVRSLQVIAHGSAASRAPENTARALEDAIADTVEWVEVDVRLTRDGQHVLFHDDELNGKTDATGRGRDHTLAEVRSADAGSKFAPRFAGERILTLDEGLRLARGRINLCLGCKDVDPALLAREVLAANMGRQVVIYANLDVLRVVRDVAVDAVGLMTKWRPSFGLTQWVKEARVHVVEIDAADVTTAVCGDFHRVGVKVQAKTLGEDDRPDVWDRMAAAGVRAMVADRSPRGSARAPVSEGNQARTRPGGAPPWGCPLRTREHPGIAQESIGARGRLR